MLRRSLVLAVVLSAALFVSAAAFAAGITIRVEGKTQTIYATLPAAVDAPNALAALEAASRKGEFYYGLTHSSFGDYVRQIGRYAAAGSAGWVFKVNGVSPPVGADQVQLEDGDSVLWYWAEFGANGGPPTLQLEADGTNCYRVTAYDDAGKATPGATAVLHVDGRRVKTPGGKGCVGAHRGLVRAYAVGTVRSNSVR